MITLQVQVGHNAVKVRQHQTFVVDLESILIDHILIGNHPDLLTAINAPVSWVLVVSHLPDVEIVNMTVHHIAIPITEHQVVTENLLTTETLIHISTDRYRL